MTSSIADQSIKDAEFEKFFQTYVDAQSSAMVDPGKLQALAEFYLPSIALYGWFGEVHSEQNSRDNVMVLTLFDNTVELFNVTYVTSKVIPHVRFLLRFYTGSPFGASKRDEEEQSSAQSSRDQD